MDRRLAGMAMVATVVLVLAGCTAQAGEPAQPGTSATSAATDYTGMIGDAVVVERSALRDRVVASGIIAGREEAILRARTGGIIRRVSFELGDSLQAGDVLLELDDVISSLGVQQLEQQYESSVADLRSKEDLFARGAIAQSQLTQARAATAALEAQMVQGRRSLGDARVRTPIGGEIAEKTGNLVQGDLVAANQQIGRIVDLGSLKISISLGQGQLFIVAKGLPATVQVRTPSGTLEAVGTVTAVSAGSDQRTGSWTAIVDLPNPAPGIIRAGMSAEVTVVNPNVPKELTVPDAALIRREGQTFVFVVNDDSTVEMVEVGVLDQVGDRVAIATAAQGRELEGRRVLVSGLGKALGKQ